MYFTRILDCVLEVCREGNPSTWGFGFVGDDASDKVGLRGAQGGHELVQLLLRRDRG